MLLSRFDFEYVLVDCFLDMQQVTSSSSSYSNGYGGGGKRRIGLKFLGETSSLRVGLCMLVCVSEAKFVGMSIEVFVNELYNWPTRLSTW